MPRYKLTVAYDGTAFHGWQKQLRPAEEETHSPLVVPADEDLIERGFATEESLGDDPHAVRTAQGVLEEAVRIVVREPVIVMGASRTDAGVHARGQVAAFTTTRDIPVEKLPRAITSRLPDDIQVLKAEIVPDHFDPIQGAIAKGYRYRLTHSCAGRGQRRYARRPLFDRHVVAHTAYRLDVELMNEAARRLIGEHDFASFARIAHGRESTVRSIFDCKVTATSRTRCHIDVVGNGFLYNMVRIIAGTLVEVGRGAKGFEPERMPQIIAAKDRRAAGSTMPPEGLCLMWIKYRE